MNNLAYSENFNPYYRSTSSYVFKESFNGRDNRFYLFKERSENKFYVIPEKDWDIGDVVDVMNYMRQKYNSNKMGFDDVPVQALKNAYKELRLDVLSLDECQTYVALVFYKK